MKEMKWSDNWSYNYCIVMLDLLRESDCMMTIQELETNACLISRTITCMYRREQLISDLNVMNAAFAQYKKNVEGS